MGSDWKPLVSIIVLVFFGDFFVRILPWDLSPLKAPFGKIFSFFPIMFSKSKCIVASVLRRCCS